MFKKHRWLTVLLFVCLLSPCLWGAKKEAKSWNAERFEFWPRLDTFYLVRDNAMPVWIAIPPSAQSADAETVLSISMPKGFDIVSWGKSLDFAVQPKPLVIPKAIKRSVNENGSLFELTLPEDIVKNVCPRVALLVSCGDSVTGEYPVSMKLVRGDDVVEQLNGKAIVLDKLNGVRPKRLRTEVFSYPDYKDATFKSAIEDAIRKSGLNVITHNMNFADTPDTLPKRLRQKGVEAWILFFWSKFTSHVTDTYPEAMILKADGKPDPKHFSYAWCMQHPNEFKALLVDYIRKNVTGKYDGILNDNEEAALTRNRKGIRGDIHSPRNIESFRKFASLPADEKLTPEIIARKYGDKWVDFRCWQSTWMARQLADAIDEADPTLGYGYYSGHKYTGALAGFTRDFYATDWDMLAKDGGIRFGSSGYYGSLADYQTTTRALHGKPHVPAEMYIQNFLDYARTIPSADVFEYRLMCAALYGGGGFGVWYAQALDGGAYYAIANATRVLSEIEDYILDGKDVSSEVILSGGLDRNAMFAMQLGARRLVVVFNHSYKPRDYRLVWKKQIPQPDTAEVRTGTKLGAAKVITGRLEPRSYAVYVTLSEGN